MTSLSDLRCPACRHAIDAPSDVTNGTRSAATTEPAEIVCAGCGARYPVRDGNPALVTPASPLHASIAREATRPSRLS